MNAPRFPPLMSGRAVTGTAHPFDEACRQAEAGCDAGLIMHNITADRLMAALVMAPEVPLEDAMAMLPACGVGFQNALGALSPPEVAVHLQWDGGLRINGAICGQLRVAAGGSDPAAMPGWLVVALDLDLMPVGDSPGDTPDRTALYEEGCAEVDATDLLEAWARHTLVWISRWEDEGPRALHAAWEGLAHGIGSGVTEGGRTGTFLGVDDRFGMLLRDAEATHLIPLSSRLEAPQ
ncbi:biotin/lipoate--protein ligase family protein [Roseovarius sp. D22-M7]|uniref:biotin/lipoate--protein ligase family protein n=1 Tax=Roseovarius sp. D22-M7 TaxID=3127116 RepID=UPI00300FBBF0